MLGKDYSEIGTLFEDGSFFWVASENCGFTSISDLAKAQASGKPPLNLTVVGPPVDNGLGKSSADLVDKLNVKRKQAGLDELLYVKNFKAEAAKLANYNSSGNSPECFVVPFYSECTPLRRSAHH